MGHIVGRWYKQMPMTVPSRIILIDQFTPARGESSNAFSREVRATHSLHHLWIVDFTLGPEFKMSARVMGLSISESQHHPSMAETSTIVITSAI